MASRKKSKNINEEELVSYIFQQLNLQKYQWEIELLILDDWIGIRIIEKQSRLRIDKGVVQKPEPILRKELLKAVKSAIDEFKGHTV